MARTLTDTGPATVVTSRVIAAGSSDDFDAWAERFDAAAREAEGHRADVRLEQPGGLVHLIYHFDSAERLENWEQSPDFAELMREGDRFSIQRRQSATGELVQFRLPSEADAPAWKQVLMTWVCVYPLIMLLSTAVKWLPGELPMPVEIAITSLALTVLLTTLIIPNVSRLLRPWLLRNEAGEVRKG